MSIDTGAVIADPFEHTAAIVECCACSRAPRARPLRALAVVVDEPAEELLPKAA